MTRRFGVMTDGGFPYFVAALDGRVVGYAYAGAYRPRPAYRFTVENSVYLDPAIHRRGIGLQLLQRVIGDSANAGSIGVHTKCGFQMIGTHPDVGFKFGRWLDTVMMQRALGAGGKTLPATGEAGQLFPVIRGWSDGPGPESRYSGFAELVIGPRFARTRWRPGMTERRPYTTASLRSITSSTRSSSWPRRRISQLAEITL